MFIDDATSRLMALHFSATESTFSYLEAMRSYLEQHGKPVVNRSGFGGGSNS
ncbi:hypothetical protein OKW35_009940 [Paraburkholderia sp. MM5477-R1]